MGVWRQSVSAAVALVVVMLLCAGDRTRADMTAVEPALLGPLAQVGALTITSEVSQASDSLQSATAQMNAKVTECNGVKATYERNCVDCVKQKCQEKASSCGKEISFTGMVINSIADFGSNVINTITDIGSSIVDPIIDTGKKIVDGIKKIIGWGRRRRSPLAREPSCSSFSNSDSAAQACLWYQAVCHYCNWDVNRDCPGYTSVKAHYDSVVSSTAWLHKIGDNMSYQVEAVSYDGSSYDPASLGWRTVSVTVSLFGRRTTFYTNTPINPFDAATAGHRIANQALAWFKTV